MLRNRGMALGTFGFFLAALSTLALPRVAAAQTPRLGQVQRLTVLTISLQVGSTEKETKRVTYSPPPGWYVRSHAVHCASKTGHSSFTVNTVPQDWAFVSEEKVSDSYKVLLELAAKAPHANLQGKLLNERNQTLAELKNVRATHHALVLEATAKGEGFLRGGGSLQLTVTADLVYVGTTASLANAVAKHKEALK